MVAERSQELRENFVALEERGVEVVKLGSPSNVTTTAVKTSLKNEFSSFQTLSPPFESFPFYSFSILGDLSQS